MLEIHTDASVIHIGCGLDSRYLRVGSPQTTWIYCDLPDVIAVRKKYYHESGHYHMKSPDASDRDDLYSLPDAPCAVAVLEGLSMYLTDRELSEMLRIPSEKYPEVHVLMDVYSVFGAKASRIKNSVNDVGVSVLYGVACIPELLRGTRLSLPRAHSFTPDHLVSELKGFDRWFFRLMFTGKMYRKICRLYELETV